MLYLASQQLVRGRGSVKSDPTKCGIMIMLEYPSDEETGENEFANPEDKGKKESSEDSVMSAQTLMKSKSSRDTHPLLKVKLIQKKLESCTTLSKQTRASLRSYKNITLYRFRKKQTEQIKQLQNVMIPK